jgi:predicted ATPase
VYHFHDTSDTAAMRRSCSARDNEYLRPDGANLAAFLLALHDQRLDVYEKIRDTIRLATPFFDDFKFRPKASNGDMVLQLEWTQKDSDYPFHASQLSDGTCAHCFDYGFAPTEALIILVDEPGGVASLCFEPVCRLQARYTKTDYCIDAPALC